MFAIASPIAITDAAYASAYVTDYIEDPITRVACMAHDDMRRLDLHILYLDEFDFNWLYCYDLIDLIQRAKGK